MDVVHSQDVDVIVVAFGVEDDINTGFAMLRVSGIDGPIAATTTDTADFDVLDKMVATKDNIEWHTVWLTEYTDGSFTVNAIPF